jgi:hypothetical protein
MVSVPLVEAALASLLSSGVGTPGRKDALSIILNVEAFSLSVLLDF